MKNLNPGIKKLVHFLRSRGFDTCDSGDGRTRDYECDRDHAYVAMMCEPEVMVREAHRLHRTVQEVLEIPLGALNEEGTTPCVEAAYQPAWGDFAILELLNVRDDDVDWSTVDMPVSSLN